MATAFIKWISQSGQIIIKNFALMFNDGHSQKGVNGTKINKGSQARHLIKKRWMMNLEKKREYDCNIFDRFADFSLIVFSLISLNSEHFF